MTSTMLNYIRKTRFLLVFVFCLHQVTGGSAHFLNKACPRPCKCQGYTVDCRHRKLRTIPSNLPTNVERINLQDNLITAIKVSDLRGLYRLKILQLIKNQISTIEPGAFNDLINLRRLRLNRNRLTQLPDGLFLKTTQLHRLDLKDNELKCVGKRTFEGLKYMRNLQIERNKIVWIASEALTNMKDLSVLRLSNNPLNCNCHLRWLNRFLSQRVTIGFDLTCAAPPRLAGKQLPRLGPYEFQCDAAERNQVTGGCGKQKCSKHCICTEDGVANCKQAGLKEVPVDLPTSIKELDLQLNQIQTLLPNMFTKYPNLRKIYLNGNQISRIAPDAFAGLPNLSILYLNFNKIKSLPRNLFKGLRRLQFLYLHGNEISCIPVDAFRGLDSLYLLHLSDNKIRSIQNGTFTDLHRLLYLYLVRNPLICDCNLRWLSQYLGVREAGSGHFASCSGPQRMAGKSVRTTPFLRFKCKGNEAALTRNIGKCRDYESCPKMCKCTDARVDCSNAKLEKIPEDLPLYTEELILQNNNIQNIEDTSRLSKLQDLKLLDLSQNKINRMATAAFSGNPNLDELRLSNNLITHVDEGIFKGLKNLKVLLLQNNKIKCLNNDTFNDIPMVKTLLLNDNKMKCIMVGTFSRLRHLESLNVNNNPLECNCHLSWMPIWLRGHIGLVNRFPLPKCSSPTLLAGTPTTALAPTDFRCQTDPMRACQSLVEPCCSKDAISCDPRAYCPPKCKCEGTSVNCNQQELTDIPDDIPLDTTELYLERNAITKINSTSLARLTKLQTLVMSYNAISVLNAFVFANLTELRTLILSFNKLQCIDQKAFAGLRELRALILQSNDVSSIPYGAFDDLINLNNIALSQNPLHCDCNIKWLNDFFRKRFLDNGLALCSGPLGMKHKSVYHSKPGDFVCPDTPDPYVARKCNACLADPCKNQGRCELIAYHEYVCHCRHPFHGVNCERQINACFGQPCKNGATCKFIDNFGNFQCICAPGFAGPRCTINVDDCAQNKCRNGATCQDLVNDYKCLCTPGYKGRFCEEQFRYCTDVNPCQNGAQCVPDVNGYKCLCLDGWQGQKCENNIDDCKYNACQNGATCLDGVNRYTCKCRPGYQGRFCQQFNWYPPAPVVTRGDSICSSHQCQNGARCMNMPAPTQYKCMCQKGYGGKFCEKLLSISFTEKSYAAIKPTSRAFLKPRGNITLELATNQSEGVILYHGQGENFLAMDLYHGHVRLIYSLGQLPGSQGFSIVKVNDHKFRTLELDIRGENVTLYIDRVFHCGLRTTFTADNRFLAINAPIYLGGGPLAVLKPAQNSWRIRTTHSFGGCIRQAIINRQEVDFLAFRSESLGLTPGCPAFEKPPNPCRDESACFNGGQCQPAPITPLGFTCACKKDFSGPRCETAPSCHRESSLGYLRDPATKCMSKRKVKIRTCAGQCNAGAGMCCLPKRYKKRRIKFICLDGRIYEERVKLIRKCGCKGC